MKNLKVLSLIGCITQLVTLNVASAAKTAFALECEVHEEVTDPTSSASRSNSLAKGVVPLAKRKDALEASFEFLESSGRRINVDVVQVAKDKYEADVSISLSSAESGFLNSNSKMTVRDEEFRGRLYTPDLSALNSTGERIGLTGVTCSVGQKESQKENGTSTDANAPVIE